MYFANHRRAFPRTLGCHARIVYRIFPFAGHRFVFPRFHAGVGGTARQICASGRPAVVDAGGRNDCGLRRVAKNQRQNLRDETDVRAARISPKGRWPAPGDSHHRHGARDWVSPYAPRHFAINGGCNCALSVSWLPANRALLRESERWHDFHGIGAGEK